MCRFATPFYQLPAYHVYSFLRNLLYLIYHNSTLQSLTDSALAFIMVL